MEKIVTLLWRPEEVSVQQFADALLGPVALQLQELQLRGLKICVRDADTEAGDALAMTVTDLPKAAMVSYWVDMAQARLPAEEILKACSASLVSFLVIESTPIINTLHPPQAGQRTSGFSQVTCVKAREDLAYDEFLRIWHNEHMACAIETQSTFQYIRNEIVRPLTGQAPAWTAIVEEGFPAAAMSNPEAFYDAVGDQKKFKANMERMMTTVSKFLDMQTIDVSAMSEYVFDQL
ncbi:MAG: hypothetical protein AB8B48_11560 [Pseudomonadales bacterium]